MLQHLAVSLRLYFRNTMALLYGYLFPTIFLVAFWVLYRFDKVPLARHMGELLTVTVLGGACFGLPTTMVSERERGVWRRYRLAPVSTESLVAGTVLARYVTVITAGLLQIALAMAIGMPLPRHPVELWIAFTCVAFAFLGLGLVIATMADNVPAVQALGQCIFLPMLIIGGVAVQLSSLPDWAQHLSAFFPGRYAVEAMQACVTGNGLGPARFSVLALLLIGSAACLAGAKMFRWDAQQRFAARAGKGWLTAALAAWLAVGLLAEARGHIGPVIQGNPLRESLPTSSPGRAVFPTATLTPAEQASAAASSRGTVPKTSAPAATSPAPRRAGGAPTVEPTKAAPAAPQPAPQPSGAKLSSWQEVTMKVIDDDLTFDRLPPDGGVVTPIAPAYEQPDPDVAEKIQNMQIALLGWKPGKVADPVQRVRNYLYVAAVPDVFQMEIERYVPLVIFDQIQQDVPKDDLIKILYWIALHPYEGDDKAVDDLRVLGIGNGPSDMEEVRNRCGIYAVKLLGRLIGKIK
jgi:ABC-type transport system involved in cytochrome c biogenesis permease component